LLFFADFFSSPLRFEISIDANLLCPCLHPTDLLRRKPVLKPRSYKPAKMEKMAIFLALRVILDFFAEPVDHGEKPIIEVEWASP